MNDLITPRHASDIASKTPATIYRLMNMGVLPAIPIDGRLYTTKTALDLWMSKKIKNKSRRNRN